VDDERQVVPDVVLLLDVVLETVRMLTVKGVAVDATDEAHLRAKGQRQGGQTGAT
jgi:hypothetical protein